MFFPHYKWVKSSTERVRPYCYSDIIFQNVAELGQFSFPSGDSLHAVGFTVVLMSYYPELAILVMPFAGLVTLSRVVLGLRYPSNALLGVGGGTQVFNCWE